MNLYSPKYKTYKGLSFRDKPDLMYDSVILKRTTFVICEITGDIIAAKFVFYPESIFQLIYLIQPFCLCLSF